MATPIGVPLSGFAPEPHFDALHGHELMEHKATESRLRAIIARDQALLLEKDEVIRQQMILHEEFHHRLMNNLQMIVSLLSLQSQAEANAEAASRVAVAANRVRAIAGLHRHLHSMDGAQTVQFGKFLDELCLDHSTMSMSEQRPDQSIVVEGIELELPTTIGIPLSLIVNELVTNAIKHGKGRIAVWLEAHPAKGYALSVCNDGSAWREGFDPVAGSGLGMKLVTALVQQIDGELRIDRDADDQGTRFMVLFGVQNLA
jgi:two-component sensor histidine kinase